MTPDWRIELFQILLLHTLYWNLIWKCSCKEPIESKNNNSFTLSAIPFDNRLTRMLLLHSNRCKRLFIFCLRINLIYSHARLDQFNLKTSSSIITLLMKFQNVFGILLPLATIQMQKITIFELYFHGVFFHLYFYLHFIISTLTILQIALTHK